MTSNKVLRAELGMYTFFTNRESRELKWYKTMWNMPDLKLPAIADRAVWQKTAN